MKVSESVRVGALSLQGSELRSRRLLVHVQNTFRSCWVDPPFARMQLGQAPAPSPGPRNHGCHHGNSGRKNALLTGRNLQQNQTHSTHLVAGPASTPGPADRDLVWGVLLRLLGSLWSEPSLDEAFISSSLATRALWTET